MKTEYDARQLDVKAFAGGAGVLTGEDRAGRHERLMAETLGLGAESVLCWRASGEFRPVSGGGQVWLHLKAETVLPLTCQRCLGPVDVAVAVERSFRFVADEKVAAAEDDDSDEDLLVLNRSLDLIELVEDELLMELPVAPRHEICPEPVKLAVADEDFEAAMGQRENPFALLHKSKTGKQ